MTKEEYRRLCQFFERNDGFAFCYFFLLAICLMIGVPVIAIEVGVVWGLCVFMPAAILWPVIGYGANQMVLAVRSRTSRNLRLERKLKRIEERERAVKALERSAGID